MIEKWTLFWALVAAQTVIVAIGLAGGTGDEEHARLVLRWTFRTPVVPFLMAFCAAAFATLRPGRTAEWLLDGRKYLGLGYAYGMLLSVVALAWLISMNVGVAWTSLSVLDRVEGYVGYAVIAVLAMTSFERFSSRMTPTTWRLLHTVGMYGLWWVFFRTNWLYTLSAFRRGLVADNWLYLLVTTSLIGALLLRATAFVVRRRIGAPATLPREPALGV